MTEDKKDTKSEKASGDILNEGIPELSMDEALQPGVVKLFLKDIKDKSDRIKILETRLDKLQNTNVALEKKTAVLETEDKYKTIREILLALVGISGGATITLWHIVTMARIFGAITIILFLTYLLVKFKK